LHFKSFSAVILQKFLKEEGVLSEICEIFAYFARDIKELGGEGGEVI
jgi:hypothetical protein